jgi:hypothetical protein
MGKGRRAVTLLPTVSKIIARILLRLERIKPEVGKKLRKSQAGFQVRCFRRDHIFTLKMVLAQPKNGKMT